MLEPVLRNFSKNFYVKSAVFMARLASSAKPNELFPKDINLPFLEFYSSYRQIAPTILIELVQSIG
jgi:hypothetical protein